MPLSVAYFTIVQLLLSARNTYASDSEHPKFSAFHFDVLPGRILVFLANASNVKQTTTNALNQPDCVEGCIDTPWCRSVNLKAKDRNKGLHLCELLSVDKFNNGRYLKADQEFTHYSLKNPCEKNANVCVNGGTCAVHANRKDYYCRCMPGYNGSKCQNDIDECKKIPPVCHLNANCTNTPGSYICQCETGFTGNGTMCTDINECYPENPCRPNSVCNNTVGSYICKCRAGFFLNGTNCTGYPERGLGNSVILVNYGNSSYFQALAGFLDPVLTNPNTSYWIKCWEAAVDGWDPETVFHRQCDGKGPSVSIARVHNYVFGAYSDIPWDSDRGWSKSKKTFIFTLYNIKGYHPMKLILRSYPNAEGNAVLNNKFYTPAFGAGMDLSLQRQTLETKPASFQFPPGCSKKTHCAFFHDGKQGSTVLNNVETFYEIT